MSALFLNGYGWKNGGTLSRARSYSDVERELNLTLQNVRTLEMKAIQKLKPALGPAFFKRRELDVFPNRGDI